jgi:Peptidase family M1 domain
MLKRLAFCVVLVAMSIPATAADLATAPSQQLLGVYAQLASLQGSAQGAIAENVVFDRDAGKFTFLDGRLTFAAPVGGRVLAAYFTGHGIFELDPPTPIGQHQIARFTGGPRLRDGFQRAVFFFTDDSYAQLMKQVTLRSAADAAAATAAFTGAEKKYSEHFNDWYDNQLKGNPQMRNLAARMLADLADPTSRGFFLADFKGEHSGDLLFHVSWNRDPLLLPEYNDSDEVTLLHVNLNNYYEWWAGFHLAGDYQQDPHPDPRTLLAHCLRENISLDVSKDNRVAASAEMDFQVNQGRPRLLPFNLRGVLRISSIVDGSGQKLDFIQEDRKLASDPWLILPSPAQPGKTYQVKITYQEDSTHDSRIINQRGSGLYYVTARESWFPSFGAFDDRTEYNLKVHSPKKYTFLGTGSEGKRVKNKDFLETEWKSPIPLSVVGFNYGNFVDKSYSGKSLTVTAYAGRAIPDELQGVSAAMDTAELAQGVGHNQMDIQTGILRGGFNTAENAKYAAGVSFQAFQLYQFYFGPLPFKSVSVTEQPVRGYGQSWPTLIFLPYDSLLDSTTRNSLQLQESPEAREFYNVVAVHEMAHQWWGHMVGWKTYHDQWLSEGFAEFSASLYLRQFEPKKLQSFWELKRKWLFDRDKAGQRPVDVGPLWLGAQLPSYMEPNLYRVLIYDKGAYVLEMLRALMYNPRLRDPDQNFIDTLHDFVSTYTGKNASTEDFRRIVEKHMGHSMNWFFDEWVYGTQIPTYDFSYQLSDGGGGKTALSMSLRQSGVSDSFRMEVPVDAIVRGKTFQLGLLGVQGSRTETGKVLLPFRPDKVEVDEESILATVHQN